MKNMEMQISIKCSVCGNSQFSYADSIEDMLNAPDETKVECSCCGRITTKRQLIDENSNITNANIEDFKDDIIKQLKKDFRNKFNEVM